MHMHSQKKSTEWWIAKLMRFSIYIEYNLLKHKLEIHPNIYIQSSLCICEGCFGCIHTWCDSGCNGVGRPQWNSTTVEPQKSYTCIQRRSSYHGFKVWPRQLSTNTSTCKVRHFDCVLGYGVFSFIILDSL